MEKTEIMEIILQRRSIREFESKPVPNEKIVSILEAGRWAPSGLNNQPWRFVVVDDEQMLFKLAYMTKYSSILLQSPTAIAVFLDREAVYARDKDILEGEEKGDGSIFLTRGKIN